MQFLNCIYIYYSSQLSDSLLLSYRLEGHILNLKSPVTTKPVPLLFEGLLAFFQEWFKLVINQSDFLYPLLQLWPVTDNSLTVKSELLVIVLMFKF